MSADRQYQQPGESEEEYFARMDRESDEAAWYDQDR